MNKKTESKNKTKGNFNLHIKILNTKYLQWIGVL